jgi:DNA-binding CsgD family transcriptional regulator
MLARPRIPITLSRRQRLCALMAAAGRTNRQIATALGLQSTEPVRVALLQVYDLLGLHGRGQRRRLAEALLDRGIDDEIFRDSVGQQLDDVMRDEEC